MASPSSSILPTKLLHHQLIIVQARSCGSEAVYEADAVKAACISRSWRGVEDREVDKDKMFIIYWKLCKTLGQGGKLF